MSTIHKTFKLYEVTLGLEYLHQEGVVHGDLRGVSNFLT